MSSTQFQALLRQLLTLLGGYMVGAGYLDAASAEAMVGALAVIGGVGWSLWASRKVGVINAASSIPEVSSVGVTNSSLAAKTVSAKVVKENDH